MSDLVRLKLDRGELAEAAVTMIGLQVLQETFGADPPQHSRGDKHINVRCEL